MMDDNHIYTLSHNIKRLEQFQDNINLDYTITPSTDHKVRESEKEKTVYHKMISSLDDILQILKDEERKPADIIYLVHKEDDLTRMLYELLELGYKPRIQYEIGRITHLIMEFNEQVFILRTQQLITSVIQYPVVVDCEIIYNKMNEAMVNFNTQIFKATHKSYYTQVDIEILDEYSTVANLGMITEKPHEQLTEIDISKAYTRSLWKKSPPLCKDNMLVRNRWFPRHAGKSRQILVRDVVEGNFVGKHCARKKFPR